MTASFATLEAIICLGWRYLRPVSLLGLSGVLSRQLDTRCWSSLIEEVMALLAFPPHDLSGDTRRN